MEWMEKSSQVKLGYGVAPVMKACQKTALNLGLEVRSIGGQSMVLRRRNRFGVPPMKVEVKIDAPRNGGTHLTVTGIIQPFSVMPGSKNDILGTVGSFMNGVNVALGDEMAEETDAPRTPVESEAREAFSLADELQKLAALLDRGVLTDSEFQTEKAKMLGTAEHTSNPPQLRPSGSGPEPVLNSIMPMSAIRRRTWEQD